jgi:lipoprotein-releasing system permease protein
VQLLINIAFKHLTARKRQSIVSLIGIVLGVAFFLAISSLMKGSENDFIKRLVDNSPHITITDEFRNPRIQPVNIIYGVDAVEINHVKPVTETRGIRDFQQIVEELKSTLGTSASPVMAGQALVNFAGKDFGVTLNGMIPYEITSVTTIEKYMISGSVKDLIANSDGIIIGAQLAKKLSLTINQNITVASTTGQVRTFKILGIFRTGRAAYDEVQTFANIKRVQALLNRSNRINTIIIKLTNYMSSRDIATQLENRIGYKSVSWQESSEDIMSTIAIRNMIMYSVVSAVLVVAAFGIYNVISTVVMEKQRDIAILKSMGFYIKDIRNIFLIQGVVLGIVGCLTGIPLGMIFMVGLSQIRIKPPGSTEIVQMPIDWGYEQFLVAIVFAMVAAILAALLPAYKAASVQPVDILRGS